MLNRESYGVDIQNSQTEESSNRSDDDKYEDSFIDDDAQQSFSPSPGLSSKGILFIQIPKASSFCFLGLDHRVGLC